jgi:hypothetical protein
MAGCQLSLPSYFLDVMTGQATTFQKSDMFDHHDYHASVWTVVALLYFLRVMTGQQTSDMAGCEFWLPSYFLHVMTGHSFKNLTWPIFTIIMLACVNFGCPDVFPMCHDRSAKWWHGRVWTLAALMYFLCVMTGQQNDDMAGCELWLPWCISYVSWQVSKMMTWQGVNFGCPAISYVSWRVTTFKKIWHGRSSRLSR